MCTELPLLSPSQIDDRVLIGTSEVTSARTSSGFARPGQPRAAVPTCSVQVSPHQLLQNLSPQLLGLAEELLIFDKQTVHLQRFVRREPLAQNHVTHVDWIGEGRFFGKFFEG